MSAWLTPAVANASALARRKAPNEPTSSICDIIGASPTRPSPAGRPRACRRAGRRRAPRWSAPARRRRRSRRSTFPGERVGDRAVGQHRLDRGRLARNARGLRAAHSRWATTTSARSSRLIPRSCRKRRAGTVKVEYGGRRAERRLELALRRGGDARVGADADPGPARLAVGDQHDVGGARGDGGGGVPDVQHEAAAADHRAVEPARLMPRWWETSSGSGPAVATPSTSAAVSPASASAFSAASACSWIMDRSGRTPTSSVSLAPMIAMLPPCMLVMRSPGSPAGRPAAPARRAARSRPGPGASSGRFSGSGGDADDVGHHARPLVQLDQGDDLRLVRVGGRHRPVVDDVGDQRAQPGHDPPFHVRPTGSSGRTGAGRSSSCRSYCSAECAARPPGPGPEFLGLRRGRRPRCHRPFGLLVPLGGRRPRALDRPTSEISRTSSVYQGTGPRVNMSAPLPTDSYSVTKLGLAWT